MIDIHMINSGRFPENFERQAERVRHPKVRLQISEPVWGNLVEARRIAYSKGDFPYVSWIDDDDEVLDMSWVDEALEILEDKNVSAVYPRWCSSGAMVRETRIHEWKLIGAHHPLWPCAHHLTIMRRQNVTPFFDEVGDRPLMRDQDILLVASQARYGRLVALPAMAYRWELREGTARSHQEPDELHAWGVDHWQQTVRMHRAL